jgi:hypothetical protein
MAQLDSRQSPARRSRKSADGRSNRLSGRHHCVGGVLATGGGMDAVDIPCVLRGVLAHQKKLSELQRWVIGLPSTPSRDPCWLRPRAALVLARETLSSKRGLTRSPPPQVNANATATALAASGTASYADSRGPADMTPTAAAHYRQMVCATSSSSFPILSGFYPWTFPQTNPIPHHAWLQPVIPTPSTVRQTGWRRIG